jgi:hypothetical protein
MRFHRYPQLEGTHAPYSPSQSAWLRYDEDKAVRVHLKKKAAMRGTILHQWAKETIDLGIKQADNGKTLNMYINDAIGFMMDTEVILYYSPRFYGTADSICFRKMNNRDVLRIHDLKTGEEPASIEQLKVYAAIFCLEYKVNPADIDMELRLYQSNKVVCCNPTAEEIQAIMDFIVNRDKIYDKLDNEEE